MLNLNYKLFVDFEIMKTVFKHPSTQEEVEELKQTMKLFLHDVIAEVNSRKYDV